jgi:hypothetical protein
MPKNDVFSIVDIGRCNTRLGDDSDPGTGWGIPRLVNASVLAQCYLIHFKVLVLLWASRVLLQHEKFKRKFRCHSLEL